MSEHIISHPTPEEREADGWTLDGNWEEVAIEPIVLPWNEIKTKVTRRRPWVRVTIERTYEYMTRIE